MNYLTLLNQNVSDEQYLVYLQDNPKDRHLFDENRNLSLYFIKEKYEANSAIRKLEFFKRL
jgi:hypothetical protein